MTVITRFAPSPTGYLHLGGARTALFNYLFARHHARHSGGGKFLLRIEDTDRARSTQAAIDAILSGLDWLGLAYDGDLVYQSRNAVRHAEVANQLLAQGTAYRCFATNEELASMRAAQAEAKQPQRYDGRWRDRPEADIEKMLEQNHPFTVRLKAPQQGATEVADLVQGLVKVENAQLDDMVLLRADGTPTYMLSVVVDDHDMAITHVIRGDDHLTNCFRQVQLYRAAGWEVPQFAHIPLIHGSDGAKLSKRHGAVDLNQWRRDGYLPEAMCNYLLRLGWSHGNDELITRDLAIDWFSLESVGRSPSRFDAKKLDSVNCHYLKQKSDGELIALAEQSLGKTLDSALVAKICEKNSWLATHAGEDGARKITSAMDGVRERLKSITDLATMVGYFINDEYQIDEKSQKYIEKIGYEREKITKICEDFKIRLMKIEINPDAITNYLAASKELQLLRIILTGSTVSQPLGDLILILEREKTLKRIDNFKRGFS